MLAMDERAGLALGRQTKDLCGSSSRPRTGGKSSSGSVAGRSGGELGRRRGRLGRVGRRLVDELADDT